MAEGLATAPCEVAEAGPVEEQTRATPGKNVEPNGKTEDWKQERLDADSLLRSLHQAHSEDEKHRKWLLKRWPEWPTEGPSDSMADPDRFLPECYLRDGEDDGSLQSFKNMVRRGIALLQGEDDESEQLDVSGVVTRLSDEGVVDAIPLLLPRLTNKALESVLSILSGRKREANDRLWLIEKVKNEWMTFAGHSENSASLRDLQRIVAVVRDPYSLREEASPGQLLLEASCPWSAARSALTEIQLEQLPLACLQVMLEVLMEDPPEVMVGTLPVGGNKERAITALLKKGAALLSYEQEGEALPEPLRKSLVVMSLSARYAYGDDGNLIDFLGPQPSETKLLQGNLLSALSNLKNLNYENLQVLHRVLLGAPTKYKKRHPGNLRHSIKRVLLDCLLRSEVRSVPEEVKTAVVTIGILAKEQLGGRKQPGPDAGLEVSLSADERVELEVESTLRISSHLQQIMYNWNEVLTERCSKEQYNEKVLSEFGDVDCNLANGNGSLETSHVLSSGFRSSRDAIRIGEERLAAHMADGITEDMTTRLENEPLDEAARLPLTDRANGVTANKPDQTENFEINRELGEAIVDPHLTRIADEAAEVGYALVGCTLERTARSSGVSLKRPARKYLRCGTMKKVRAGPGEGTDVQQHQLAIILKIAEKIPAISPRVMANVKRRLGMG